MGHSLSEVFIHLVFSTKDRQKLITNDINGRLCSYIAGICNGLDCTPKAIGGYYDHIHVLCLLSKHITIVDLVSNLKKQSSKWIKEQSTEFKDFYWQSGYGIFSVNKSQVPVIIKYIMNQEEHHKKFDFKQEYLAILKKLNIEYDESYLWT